MSTILYIHGFASSGNSGTPQMLRQMLYRQGVQVIAPDVPVSPATAMVFLRQLVGEVRPDLIIATSMGAFYAEQLRGFPRILVNPSFQMSRMLTFGGLGRQAFRNKREDGAHEFKVDQQMISEFRTLEKNTFRGITPDDRALVWGLFGSEDHRVDFREAFIEHYGAEHSSVFEGGHQLNDFLLNRYVLPLAKHLLGLRD